MQGVQFSLSIGRSLLLQLELFVIGVVGGQVVSTHGAIARVLEPFEQAREMKRVSAIGQLARVLRLFRVGVELEQTNGTLVAALVRLVETMLGHFVAQPARARRRRQVGHVVGRREARKVHAESGRDARVEQKAS